MKAELPTEEDVLAALLVLWLEGQGVLHDVPDDKRGVPVAVGWVAWDRALPTVSVQSIEAAIADSERRLEVERARADVLGEARRHARVYRAFGDRADAIGQAVEDLERAEAEVSRHGG